MSNKEDSAEKAIRDIRRATRRQYSAEEKIRIVLEGLRGESSIAELCRKEGINQNLYYRWSKEFLEAGKKRLAGDTSRQATSDEVQALRREAAQLKEALAESVLENRLLKKSTFGAGVKEINYLRIANLGTLTAWSSTTNMCLLPTLRPTNHQRIRQTRFQMHPCLTCKFPLRIGFRASNRYSP